MAFLGFARTDPVTSAASSASSASSAFVTVFRVLVTWIPCDHGTEPSESGHNHGDSDGPGGRSLEFFYFWDSLILGFLYLDSSRRLREATICFSASSTPAQ